MNVSHYSSIFSEWQTKHCKKFNFLDIPVKTLAYQESCKIGFVLDVIQNSN